MENQSMSSSSPSTTNPKELRSNVVAMEKSIEKAPMLDLTLRLGFSHNVVPESRIDKPSFGVMSAARKGKEIMKSYRPAKSNKTYTCQFCKKDFLTRQALGGHQNAHKEERESDKKQKEMEAKFPGYCFMNPDYLDKPHLLLGGYSPDALTHENHLGITLRPCKRVAVGGVTNMNMAIVPHVTPNSLFTGNMSSNGEATEGVAYMNMAIVPQVTRTSFFTGNTSSNGEATGGVTDMNVAIVPRVTPTRFFTGDTSSNGSDSMGLDRVPSHNPLIPKKILPLPQTTNVPRGLSLHKTHLRENNLLSMIVQNVVEIDDDDDQPAKKKSRSEIRAPPQTTNVSRGLSLQENALSEKDLFSKIGMHDVVEIVDDDDDEPEEGKSKRDDMIDLTLSL